MAPAIVHFLVGAALVLLVATPLALRNGGFRNQLWLVVIGGLWGLFPDLAHMTPVSRTELRRLHESRWADVFAFHYTLDQPPFDTHPFESTALAISLFFAAVLAFTVSGAVGSRTARSVRSVRYELAARALAAVYAVIITGIVAGTVAGVAFAETSRIESLAALAGREHPGTGWALLLLFSLAATSSFAVLCTIVDIKWNTARPILGALVGLFFAIAAWTVVVAIALPIWLRVVLDLPQSVPYVHWSSLLVLLGFGPLLGLLYPFVRQLIAPPTDRSDA